MPAVASLDHLVLTVTDIDASVAFYKMMGMRVETFCPADGSKRTALTFGSQKINLHRSGSEFEPKAALARPGTADLCFLSDAPLDEWVAHLEASGLTVIEGPVLRTGATGPLRSLYLQDPDGNLIEIANRF